MVEIEKGNKVEEVLMVEDFETKFLYSTKNPNVEIYEANDLSRLNSMRVVTIQNQQFHVMINLVIQGGKFFLKHQLIVPLT